MRPEQPEDWITARHEAGHAVAALHYGCPMEHVSIEAAGATLGTTRLGVSKLADAVVIFCGPLSEKSWDDFMPGVSILIETVGADQEALLYLRMTEAESSSCFTEALTFLCKSDVQQQIDRVAGLLMERRRVTRDEVCASAGFVRSLASHGWG